MDFFTDYIQTSSFKTSYHDYFNRLKAAAQKVESKPIPSLFHPIIIAQDTFKLLQQQSEQMAAILEKNSESIFRKLRSAELF